MATEEEARELIDRRGLMGRGIGSLDVHLLASTILTPDARIWTGDRRFAEAASALGIAYAPLS